MILDREVKTAEIARTINDIAVSALVGELICYPKPGLVSLLDRGSHTDMDASTFICSIASLHGYFEEMAEAGGRGADFATLNAIGVAAEQRMLAATEGVNTHRGAVFSLGLLAASAGYMLVRNRSVTAKGICQTVGKIWGHDILRTRHQCSGTNGSAVRARYGVDGAREHAASGFPIVTHHALPALNAALRANLDRNWAGVHAFLSSIAALDDTNLLHRGGADGLAFAKAGAKSVLIAGGALSEQGRLQARTLHHDFIASWLSPGGSADILALTYFVHDVESVFGA